MKLNYLTIVFLAFTTFFSALLYLQDKTNIKGEYTFRGDMQTGTIILTAIFAILTLISEIHSREQK